jgi:hypothetical protein
MRSCARRLTSRQTEKSAHAYPNHWAACHLKSGHINVMR